MVVLVKSKVKPKEKSKKKLSLYNPNSRENKIKRIFLAFIYLVLAVYFGKSEYSNIEYRINYLQKTLPIEDQNKLIPILKLIVNNLFSFGSQDRWQTIFLLMEVVYLLNYTSKTYKILKKSNNENLKLSIQNITMDIIISKIVNFFFAPLRKRSV